MVNKTINHWCQKCEWLTNECHCKIYEEGKCTNPCCDDDHPFWKVHEIGNLK